MQFQSETTTILHFNLKSKRNLDNEHIEATIGSSLKLLTTYETSKLNPNGTPTFANAAQKQKNKNKQEGKTILYPSSLVFQMKLLHIGKVIIKEKKQLQLAIIPEINQNIVTRKINQSVNHNQISHQNLHQQ